MAVLDQVATAIERVWLAQEHEASSLAAETERVRNALLISVSHDLRTPLTAIIGSLSTLDSLDKTDDGDNEKELTSIALAEAQRLDRFIGNLLDITRLELGGLDVKTSPVNIDDVVESVLERAQPLLQNHRTAVQIPETLPAVAANYVLLEQAIFNLVDNAGKYSPTNSEIRICAHCADKEVVIEVSDQGSGIPDQLSLVIFRKFARLAHGDAKPPGTGLGLTIAKGFVEAMKGTIAVANRSDSSGAIFTIRLPAVLPSPGRAFPA